MFYPGIFKYNSLHKGAMTLSNDTQRKTTFPPVREKKYISK